MEIEPIVNLQSLVSYLIRAPKEFILSTYRLVVLISGSGSNLQAILDAIDAGELAASVVLVVSNRREAYGLVRAQQAGIPTLYVPFHPYRQAGKGREVYDADVAEKIRPFFPHLLVLAGWMHVFTPAFLDQFPQQVINLHPALPGTLPGTQAIERAFAAYQQGEHLPTGCMVHYVIPEVDAGAVIAQQVVPIEPSDTLADFTARMHQAEHRLLVSAIRQVMGRGKEPQLG